MDSLTPWLEKKGLLFETTSKPEHYSYQSLTLDGVRAQILRISELEDFDGSIWTVLSDGLHSICACFPQRVVDQYNNSGVSRGSQFKALRWNLLSFTGANWIVSTPLFNSSKRTPTYLAAQLCLKITQFKFFGGGDGTMFAKASNIEIKKILRLQDCLNSTIRKWCLATVAAEMSKRKGKSKVEVGKNMHGETYEEATAGEVLRVGSSKSEGKGVEDSTNVETSSKSPASTSKNLLGPKKRLLFFNIESIDPREGYTCSLELPRTARKRKSWEEFPVAPVRRVTNEEKGKGKEKEVIKKPEVQARLASPMREEDYQPDEVEEEKSEVVEMDVDQSEDSEDSEENEEQEIMEDQYQEEEEEKKSIFSNSDDDAEEDDEDESDCFSSRSSHKRRRLDTASPQSQAYESPFGHQETQQKYHQQSSSSPLRSESSPSYFRKVHSITASSYFSSNPPEPVAAQEQPAPSSSAVYWAQLSDEEETQIDLSFDFASQIEGQPTARQRPHAINMSTVSETMEVREESSDSSQEQREVELSLTGGKEENFREVPGLAKIKMGMRNSLDRKTPSLLVESSFPSPISNAPVNRILPSSLTKPYTKETNSSFSSSPLRQNKPRVPIPHSVPQNKSMSATSATTSNRSTTPTVMQYSLSMTSPDGAGTKEVEDSDEEGLLYLLEETKKKAEKEAKEAKKKELANEKKVKELEKALLEEKERKEKRAQLKREKEKEEKRAQLKKEKEKEKKEKLKKENSEKAVMITRTSLNIPSFEDWLDGEEGN